MDDETLTALQNTLFFVSQDFQRHFTFKELMHLLSSLLPGLVGAVVGHIYYHHSKKKQPSARTTKIARQAAPVSPFSGKHWITPEAQQRLKTLTHGNASLAIRLLEQTAAAHSGKSEQWVYEKTIWDLERDYRRGR